MKFVILYYYSGVYRDLDFSANLNPILLFWFVPLLVFHNLSIQYYYSAMYDYLELKSRTLAA
jgi:hypothetical protein